MPVPSQTAVRLILIVWRGLEIRIVSFVASSDGEEDITKAARQVLEGHFNHIGFFSKAACHQYFMFQMVIVMRIHPELLLVLSLISRCPRFLRKHIVSASQLQQISIVSGHAHFHIMKNASSTALKDGL